jgi:CBS domain-containing protein
MRALALAAATHPPPPVRHCWIALGSAGCEKQTLVTDQDNGLIFECPAGTDPRHLREGVLPNAREANRLLDVAGYAPGRGGIMAGNPQWCLSVDEWRARFATWLSQPDPQALLNATIFFDFRAVDGDARLAHALRAGLRERAPDATRCLLLMARNALVNAPPLGVIRDFVLARGGEHPGTIDLKVHGVQPFVEAARVLALGAGAGATGTAERMKETARLRGIVAVELQAWIEAVRFPSRGGCRCSPSAA